MPMMYEESQTGESIFPLSWREISKLELLEEKFNTLRFMNRLKFSLLGEHIMSTALEQLEYRGNNFSSTERN